MQISYRGGGGGQSQEKLKPIHSGMITFMKAYATSRRYSGEFQKFMMLDPFSFLLNMCGGFISSCTQGGYTSQGCRRWLIVEEDSGGGSQKNKG